MANNSYISKVNLPNNPTTYYIKDEEARDSLLQLQNEFVSKDGDTIDGTLNVTDVNAGTLLVTGNASFVNGLHGDLDGNATTATLAVTATEANHAATATTATSATSAEKIRINNEDVSVGDYLTPAYFIDGEPIQSAGKTIPLINGTGTTAGTWLGSLTGLTAYSDGLLILYKIPIAGASTTTLNINNIGAKTVYWNNASKLTTHFPVNQIIMLVYCASLNSGSWVCIDTYNSDADHYTTPWCNTSAGTAAKVATCNGYVLRQNQVFPILMATSNTSQSLLTLNINGTGAKNVYINGTISSSSNYTLPAGIYFIYYDGTNYYFRTDNTIDADISGNAATADSAITATKANKVIDSNNNSTEITITSSKTAQTTTSNLASWNGNEIGKISPETLKEVMSLDNVENKSSATIRGELTQENVINALGYTPPTEDTDTHYTTHIYAGNGTAANSTSDLTDPKIAVADNTTVAGTNGYIQLKGDGLTDVKAKNGIITINTPTSHDHTTDDIVPIQTMTYTGILGTADNSAASDSFYFMRMRPITFYDQWMLHYRVTAFIPNQTNYRTTSDVVLYGYGQASVPAMKTFNTVYNTSYRPIYYNNFYRLNSTGYNGNCYNAVGVGLNGSNARNNAGYERTIVVELLETYNCTAELLNSVVKWANWESALSNYAGFSQFDACTNGLQETGDNDNVTTQRFQYSHLTAGENGIKMYSLVMMDSSGKWQSFTTGSGGTATTKAKNTTGFVPGMIYYVNRNSDLDPNGVTADNQLHRHINLVDLRYSTNCGQTLTANKMVYIVGTMSDGLFYLDKTWWTQTEPTQADDKVYIPIGITYDKYRADLLNWQGMYYHNGTNFVPYYEATASSHATSSDLLEFQSTIPTNASQVGNAGTIAGLTVSKIGSISDFATTDVYAPASNAGMLLNMGYSDTYGHQVFVDDTSNLLTHRYNNNGTWQNWQQILDTSIFPISIENGGTNATTIQDAANNLQVVSLGQGIPITTTQNTDIDNIVAIGNYYCSSNSYVSSLQGTLPSGLGNNAFTLKVGYSTGTGFKYQELRQYSNGRTWYRVKGNNSDSANWGSWNPYYQLSSIALTGDTTGTATSTVGAWSIATQTKRVHYLGRLTSANLDFSSNDYKSKLTYMLATTAMTEGKPPDDAGILNFAWDNNKWGSQLAIRMTSTPHIYIRGNNNVSWDTNWLTVLDSNNYTDYTVTKTGGGASGDWNINAATATKFSSTQTIELTGDITGSDTKDGSSGWLIETSLANSGVTSGSYGQSTDTSPDYNGTFNVPYFTVDTKGRITSASTKTVTLPVEKKVYDKIIDANFATNYRTQTKGDTNSGWYISAIRNNTANVANSPQYGSGLGWGVSDTHGYLYTDYRANNPGVYVGGGNANKLNWIKALAFADGTNASGTWGISITGNATTATSATSAVSATTATKFSSDKTIELTGVVTGSDDSDGTSGWSIATSIGDGAITNDMLANNSIANGKLSNSSITIAGQEISLGGSITLEQMGLSTAMHFIGRATVARDNANFPAIDNYTPASGDVVLGLNDDVEYVYDGTSWLILGAESSYKVVQTVVNDPEPSGYSSTFISSISQNRDGVISVDKKNLPAILLSGDASGTGTVSNDATDVTISVSSVKATLLKPYSAANTTVATGHDNTGVNSNNGERVQNVWQQNFSDKRLKYTKSGTSTKSTITDTGYLMLFLTGNANANQAYLNMKIDGTYYGNFSGTLSGTIESFKTGQNVTENDSTNSGIGYVSVTAADWNNNKTTGAIYRHVKDSNNVHQIFGDYSTGQLAVRGKAAGTWSDWRVVLDSQNWSNYIDTSVNTTIYVGESATASNSETTNTNTYITVASNSSVATSNGSIKIQGGGDVSVTSDNAGTITVSCNDTHNTAYIYAGTSTGNANATTTDGNTHIILKDGNSVSSRVKIAGDGATSVVSDANGTITISSTNTWTPMTGATSSANGTVGYVNTIPPSNGYNTKYLRADGTWAVPPDTWNPLVGAQQNVDGTAGYAPQPLKGTDYNKKYLCSDGTWKKPSVGDLSGVPISIENGGTGENSDLAAITSLGSIYTKAGGTQITSQKNLDTEFNTPGTYYSSQKSISENLLGTVPITGSGFKLYTIGGYSVNRPRQIIDAGGSNTALLQRTSTDGGSSWNKWHKFVFIPSGNDNKTFNDVGSPTQPVYVTSSGVVTAITGAIANDITGNAATATKFASAKTVELTGDVAGSVSNDGTNGWSIDTTTNRLTSLGRYTGSLNDIDFSNGSYKGKIVFLHADANTLYKPNYGEDGVGGGTNGSVINIGWDNRSTATDNKYGAQIMLTNGTTTGSGTGATQMYIRGRHTNDNWDEWRKVLNSGNWSDYITISTIGLGVVSKTANGLVPQLPNETTTTKYLRQDGTWAIPDINELSNIPLSIANGGTGASTAIDAITNLSGLSTGTIGNDIEANKNLDTDFGTPGTYRSVDGTRTGTLSGSKPVTTGFKMYVTQEYSNARRKQIIQGSGATNLFQRYRRTNSTTWESWYRFIFAEGNSGVGSSTQPVYVDSSGVVTAITGDLANNITGNAATATKATQDGNGNVITSTYLPLSGGTMTGGVTFPSGSSANNNNGIIFENGSKIGENTNGALGIYGNSLLYLRPIVSTSYGIQISPSDISPTTSHVDYPLDLGRTDCPFTNTYSKSVYSKSIVIKNVLTDISCCRLEFSEDLNCLNFIFD